MKKLLVLTLALSLFAMSASLAVAAPFNAVGKNPNIVEHFPGPDDVHAIIGLDGSDEVFHVEGRDLVMKAGKSGNFQQWFENGVGYHSVWRHIGDKTECPENWAFLENPTDPPEGETWGHHLEEGNYCVSTNEYSVGQGKHK